MAPFDNRNRMVTLQLLGWGVILCTTLFWSVDSGFELFDLVMFSVHIFPLIVIYIINYTIIIPRLIFKHRYVEFVVINFIFIAILLLISYALHTSEILHNLISEDRVDMSRRGRKPIFLARDFINYVMTVGMVTSVRLVDRFKLNNEALKVAERERVKSELENLKNQINPHFLLNTLNNIYSLTFIDNEKAQKAITELSRLLQYMLYDNHGDRVMLTNEVAFIKNYIELMRIRLNQSVKIDVNIQVKSDSYTEVAPLIFISLVENAFKHGVAAESDSFISIELEDRVEEGEIYLAIQNSNHAKGSSDKSGHGIGLEQVKKRLDLLYNDSYSWKVEQNEERYSSIIILKTDK